MVLFAIPKSNFIRQIDKKNNVEIFTCFVRFISSMESLSSANDWHVTVDISFTLLLPLHLLSVRRVANIVSCLFY